MSPSAKAFCSDDCPSVDSLAELLDPLADISREVAEHLGSCPHCLQTLEWLAGGESGWEEAKVSLTNTHYENHRHQATLRIVNSICALSGAESAPQDPLCEHEIDQLTRMLEPASHPELLGRIGRYELEQLIGRGGMGLVFRAYDTELHRIVAVKTLAVHLVPLGAARERFVREGRACAALLHPHIVPIHDVITDGPVPALVMQLVAGSTLEERIQQGGPLPWRQASELMIQLLDGLSSAHGKGFVHRDIKPGNVLLEADGCRALLTDFGLVRTLDDATLTHSGMLAGTPDYMSPEQARGKSVESSSDLFSMGAMFYTMLTGRPPFHAPDPMAILNRICHEPQRSVLELSEEVPREVSDFVDCLMQKSPSQRTESAAHAKAELEKIARAPIQVVQDGFGHRHKSDGQPSVWKTWLPSLILLLIAIGVWNAPAMYSNQDSAVPPTAEKVDEAALDVGQNESHGEVASQLEWNELEADEPLESVDLSSDGSFQELELLGSQIESLRREVGAMQERPEWKSGSRGGSVDEASWIDTRSLRMELDSLERRVTENNL